MAIEALPGFAPVQKPQSSVIDGGSQALKTMELDLRAQTHAALSEASTSSLKKAYHQTAEKVLEVRSLTASGVKPREIFRAMRSAASAAIQESHK